MAQVTFQEVVGGARELLVCAYVHALMIMRAKFNVSKFSLYKKKKKFRQRHALAKLAKIFSRRKFPHIQYFKRRVAQLFV